MLRNITSLQKRSCVFRNEQGLPASIDTILMDVQDYRLLPRYCWDLQSSGKLSTVCRKLFVEVSGQLICPVSRVNHPAWTTWPLNMGLIDCPETLTNNYQHKLCNIPEEQRCYWMFIVMLNNLSGIQKQSASFKVFKSCNIRTRNYRLLNITLSSPWLWQRVFWHQRFRGHTVSTFRKVPSKHTQQNTTFSRRRIQYEFAKHSPTSLELKNTWR